MALGSERKSMSFTAEGREVLTGLAEGLLPLSDWVATKSYVPPDHKALPWRNGETLTHERLRSIAYVEWLVAASDADDLLLARWDHIKQDPLAFCPLPAARAFRDGRGLSQAPRFATVEAGNALADASGRQMSRQQLYDQCLPILIATVRDAQKRTGPDALPAFAPPPSPFWIALAKELHRGNCREWRAVAGAPQSTLLTEQLLRDVLTALLNGWLEVPPPWRYAVLIELGEYRRPGNAYTREDVEKARQSFQAALEGSAPPDENAKAQVLIDDLHYATQWKSIP